MKYVCVICGKEYDDHTDALYHLQEVHEDETGGQNLEVFIEVLGTDETAYVTGKESKAVVHDTEKQNLDETPEPTEILDESTIIKEEDLLTEDFIRKAVADWDKWSEGEKKHLLSFMLGSFKVVKEGEKLKVIPRTNKYFAYSPKIEEAVQEYYTELIEKLQDPERTVCAVCGRPWTEESHLTTEEEQLWGGESKRFEVSMEPIRAKHIFYSHPAIWSLISQLYPTPKTIRNVDEAFTSNPESCSKEAKKLSKEELAEEISKSPELRAELFRKWKAELSKNKRD